MNETGEVMMTDATNSGPSMGRSTVTAEDILNELGAPARLAAVHAHPDHVHGPHPSPAPWVNDLEEAESLTLVRLADVRPERIDWLWPGYLARGKLHVIDGDPGLGKSTMTIDLAARITTGGLWPDGQTGCRPGGVVLMSAEDGLGDTIRPRLDAAGADAERVSALTGIRYFDPTSSEVLERLPTLPDDVARLRHAVDRTQAALVVVDPLMAYLGGDVNSYRDQDVRRALAPLARTAEVTGAAVVLVRHLTKGGGPNAIYRGGGSIGIIGAARLGFAVVRDPDDEQRVIVACTKANITAHPPSLAYRLVDVSEHGCARVEWEDSPVSYTATDLLAAASEGVDERSERRDAADWLACYLVDQGGSAAVADIMKAAKTEGISERTLRRARIAIGVASTRAGFPARSAWSLHQPQSGQPHDHGQTEATSRNT